MPGTQHHHHLPEISKNRLSNMAQHGRHGQREKSKFGGLFDDISKDLHAMYGEFIGTVLFLLLGMASVQATVTNLSINTASASGTSLNGSDAARLMGLFYISAGFGWSLFAIASIFYRFTGSIFNPNVSFALLMIGAIKPVRFVLVVIAQLVGAIVASAILDALTPGGLSVGCNLGFGTNTAQGLFIEMFITAALVLSVLMLAAEKSAFTPIAPLGFGFTLFVCELFAVEYTGGSVNTARAFGPAVISGFSHYHWIYWVGPTLGSLLATGFYYILKTIKYWEISPGQDSTDWRDAPQLKPMGELMQNVQDAIPIPIPGINSGSTGSEETNVETAVDAAEIGMAAEINAAQGVTEKQPSQKEQLDGSKERRAHVEARA